MSPHAQDPSGAASHFGGATDRPDETDELARERGDDLAWGLGFSGELVVAAMETQLRLPSDFRHAGAEVALERALTKERRLRGEFRQRLEVRSWKAFSCLSCPYYRPTPAGCVQSEKSLNYVPDGRLTLS